MTINKHKKKTLNMKVLGYAIPLKTISP